MYIFTVLAHMPTQAQIFCLTSKQYSLDSLRQTLHQRDNVRCVHPVPYFLSVLQSPIILSYPEEGGPKDVHTHLKEIQLASVFL